MKIKQTYYYKSDLPGTLDVWLQAEKEIDLNALPVNTLIYSEDIVYMITHTSVIDPNSFIVSNAIVIASGDNIMFSKNDVLIKYPTCITSYIELPTDKSYNYINTVEVNNIPNPNIINPIHYPDAPKEKEDIERAWEITKQMCNQ